MSAQLCWNPPSPKSYILTFQTAFLEQSLRAIWGAMSRADVLFLLQINVNLPLSNCASLLVDSYGDRWSDPEWTPLLWLDSTRSTALVPAAALRLFGEFRQIRVSLSWFSKSALVEILSFIWQWSRLPAPSHLKTYRVGSTDEISGAHPLTV